jgi:phospholipase D1/2
VFTVCVLQAGEPYRVYIVIPMFPEGIPTSGSCQAILYYQYKTRQMMYK